MRKNLSITLTPLALLGGAGEDVSATGKVVTDTARKTIP